MERLTLNDSKAAAEYIEEISFQKCSHCGNKFDPDFLAVHGPSGCLLCNDCMDEYMEVDREVTCENDIRRQLAECPADELIALEFALSIAYSSIKDKRGLENLTLWFDRVKDAKAMLRKYEADKQSFNMTHTAAMAKVTPTVKVFEMRDNAGQPCQITLVEFLMDNREELTINNRRELHRAAVGETVIINGFVGHQAFLKRIK